MKIKMMNKQAQMACTGYQLETLKAAFLKEWKDTEISKDEISSFACLYTGEGGSECLKFEAEMAFKNYEPSVW